jgi:hypothetical protein
MKLIKSKKGVALLAALAVAVVAAVGAYAYFSSTGTGTGSASVGSSTAFTIASDAATGGPLTPAGGALTYESVKYNVTNPSSGAQKLNNVNIQIAGKDSVTGLATAWSVSGGTNPDCTKGDFQLSVDGGTTWAAAGASVNDTALAADLAAGTTTAKSTVMIRMIDTLANQDNCQGATVPLYFSAS